MIPWLRFDSSSTALRPFDDLLGVYTFRSSDRPVGPTGLSDQSDRPVGQTVAEAPTYCAQISVWYFIVYTVFYSSFILFLFVYFLYDSIINDNK